MTQLQRRIDPVIPTLLATAKRIRDVIKDEGLGYTEEEHERIESLCIDLEELASFLARPVEAVTLATSGLP